MWIVAKGQTVTFQCSLFLEDGTCLDDPNDTKPFTARVGANDAKNFLDVIGSNLVGMKLNEQKTITVLAKDAFGTRDNSRVHKLATEEGDDFRVGDSIRVKISGRTEQVVDGVVVNVSGQHLEVDTNHPLAGKNILAKVKVLSIKN
jgi:FKBP-type peptidyl-prolyl cis-trans isomerase SlpA